MFDKPISRRALLARCALVLAPSLGRGGEAQPDPFSRIRTLELSGNVRIGVSALDTGSGRAIFYRERERFLFCSTWKFLLVAALLARVDRGDENLARIIHFQRKDLLPHAPVAALHLDSGMTLEALCEAAMTVSDNTAANLLLTAVGGFPGFAGFVRSLGDETTELVRNEPTLNVPDGEKDTTTPVAMMRDMWSILLGDTLRPGSRKRMVDWLAANTTGDAMLRAGIPSSWRVGDKTGHGDSASNDIAIATPPGREPVLIAAYTFQSSGKAVAPAMLAEIGRIVADAWAF